MEAEAEPVLDRDHRIAARRKRIEERNVKTSEEGAHVLGMACRLPFQIWLCAPALADALAAIPGCTPAALS